MKSRGGFQTRPRPDRRRRYEIRTLLCNYLADFGIASHSVQDGAAMRAALAGEHYDVVILDVMLPGEDGLTLCRQLRAATGIYIIMLTARGELTDRVLGLEMGADDYMVKPFDPRELVARIHTLLRRGKSNGSNALQRQRISQPYRHLVSMLIYIKLIKTPGKFACKVPTAP